MHLSEIPSSDFPDLFNELEGQICYNSIRTSLAFYFQDLLDKTRIRMWCAKSNDENNFVAYAMVHIINNKSNRIVIQSNTTKIDFSVQCSIGFAPLIYGIVREHNNLFIYCTELTMALQLEKYFSHQKTHLFKRLDERHINYFSSTKQRELLINNPIDLPEGFHFDNLKAKDAEDILRDQALNKTVDLEVNRVRLEKFPSATIYHDGTGELACFQMVDGIGYIAPRFTRCKYSNYGLCAYIERMVAKKLTECGVVPAKSISFQNTYCIQYSDQSPIWTKLLDERGCAVAKQYLILSKEPGHQIEFFESCVNW